MPISRKILLRTCILLLVVLAGSSPHAEAQPVAPELAPNLGWMNTDRPLRLQEELRGHVVLLDFWTYCCINCMHILPDLEFLEEKYADEPFVVVGVHSAKFTNEAQRESIRNAIFRYGIKHPVVVDDEFAIWRRYDAHGWPTFVVIGADGRLIEQTSGEGNRNLLDSAIRRALADGRSRGVLAHKRVQFKTDASVAPPTGLYYPGKTLAIPGKDDVPGFLFISDSSNNRVVVATWPDEDGRSRLVEVYGDGERGFADGAAQSARFHDPQGMAFDPERKTLFVADTKNHSIRAIDLDAGLVRTIVGTGKQSYDRRGGGVGVKQGISSPWALALDTAKRRLFIAMAGTHQLWSHDLVTGTTESLAGSGQEDIVDGPAQDAHLAQPSGLAISSAGARIYFADSEVSAVRTLDLERMRVTTIVGQGLFEFGDVDGAAERVRLQHPLGVATWGGSERGDRLLIADTYNHKIKLIDPAAQTSVWWFGAERGEHDLTGWPALNEPGGLSFAGAGGAARLFIADTNNHRILMVDPATRDWREVVIDGLHRPGGDDRNVDEGVYVEAGVAPGAPLRIELVGSIPGDQKLSIEAPVAVTIEQRRGGESTRLVQRTWRTDSFPVQIEIPARDLAKDDELRVLLSYATCDDGRMLCIPRDASWRIVVRDGEGASGMLHLGSP